jgi:hypothetical protein
LRLSWPGKKQSRGDFPFTDVWISYKIFPDAFFEREIGPAVFLALPTQTQTALFLSVWLCFYPRLGECVHGITFDGDAHT